MGIFDGFRVHLGSDATRLADQLGFAEKPFAHPIGFEDLMDHFYGRMERGDPHQPLIARSENIAAPPIALDTMKLEGAEGELPAGSLVASQRLPIASDPIPEDVTAYFHDQQARNAALAEMAAILKKQRKERRETASFEVDFGVVGANFGNLIPQGVHLPEGAAIAFAYCENNGAASKINVYVGGQGSGRLLAVVNFGHWACFPIPDNIKSLSIVSTAADTGLARIAITTETWAPARGAF